MKPINNLDIIKPLLKFESDDDFIHLQILKRKKEHPELGRNSEVVKTYYVTSIEYLEGKMDEIINLCEFHNARAYINLNRRSFEKVARHTLLKVTNQVVLNKDYYSVRKAYESVAGGIQQDKNGQLIGGILNETKASRKWVVDYDEKSNLYVSRFMEELNSCSTDGELIIITTIPTKNGYHFITKPFNVKEFSERVKVEYDIHKNNPTILYMKT